MGAGTLHQGHRAGASRLYFQNQRQDPPGPRAATATLLARRATRRGAPEATALMSLEILAAR